MSKKSRTYTYFLVFSILGLLANSFPSLALPKNIIMGCIQLPRDLQQMPAIRIYCGGRHIKGEIDELGHQIRFNIPKSADQNQFYVLITEHIGFELCDRVEQGYVVRHQKLLPNTTYKLFEVTYNNTAVFDEKNVKKQVWTVVEKRLPMTDLRIPDHTIIVRYNPIFIDTMVEKNEFELPTILFKHNSVLLAGSEKAFQDLAAAMIIASIDADTLHTPEETMVKFEKQRVLVALSA
jgi:hypothetical protein